MKKENNTPKTLNLNSDLIRSTYTNKTLMENLKDHLQFLENKHSNKSRSTLLTSLLSTVVGTSLIAGSGFGYFAEHLNIDTTTTASLATLGGLALGTSLVTGIISHHQNKKAQKYKYLGKLAEAGLEDVTKVEKTKSALRKDSSIEEVGKIINPELARYIEMHNLSFFNSEEPTNEDQLSFEGF